MKHVKREPVSRREKVMRLYDEKKKWPVVFTKKDIYDIK